MKQLKVTSLFFCFLVITLFLSCNKTEGPNPIQKIPLDTISSFIQKMRDNTLSDNIRLQHANTALQYAKKLNLHSKTTYILEYKIYLFEKLNQYDSAIYTSKKVINLVEKRNDSISIGRIYPKMAYYFKMNKQKDSAYYFYNLIKNTYLTFNDSIIISNILLDLAIIESDFGDYNGSDYSATQALKYLNNNTKNYTVPIYNCLAINSRKQFDYKEALHYYDLALENSITPNEKTVINNNKANVYRDLKEYDKSIVILKNLLKISTPNHRTKARIIDNLAYTKWLANKNEKVLPELKKALTIRLQENDLYGSIASYAHLSEYYKKNNPKISLSYASMMYKVATIQNSSQDKLEALQKLISLETFSKTKEYYNTYVRINDSIQKINQIAKNQFAKIKFDSEKNRNENLKLRINNTADQLEIEKQKKNNIILFVLGSAIVFGLLIFVYYRKQKHLQEKRAEVYKTETRIAKKIHDEVANDMVNIMNKIQFTGNSPEQLLDDLEKVYLLTRNISHENNAIETGVKFENYLKNMLASFNNEQITIIIKDIHKVGLSSMVKEKQIEIYRILQEIMVNMRKHSKATLVAISFINKHNKCIINYSDNGIGYDTEKFTLKSGLKYVESRIKSIQGTVTFETALGKGFKVFISLKN